MEEQKAFDFRSGIFLHPLLKNRFTAEFYGWQMTKEQSDAMACQMINFKVDLAKKKISFDIQQPLMLTDLFFVVSQFTDSPSRVVLALMDGNATAVGKIEFHGLELVKHDFELDYASSAVATHNVVMTYSNLTGA